MDRNEILANFQACTGVEDIGECMAILEMHEWDLPQSVTATLAKEQNGHSVINTNFYQSNSQSLLMQPAMLTFSCHLDSIHKEVTLDDTNSVGNLKEIVSVEFGIPVSEVVFDSWPPESTNSNPSDSTMLSTLHLSAYNVMKIKTHGMSSGVSFNLQSTDEISCSNSRSSRSPYIPCDVNDLMKTFSLELTNHDNNQKHILHYEGIKTFQELKQDVINLTGISYKDQEWSGFPNPPDDNSTLASLNLNQPTHTLSIQSKSNLTKSCNSKFSTLMDMSQQILSADHVSTSDDEYDLDDDLIFSSAPKANTQKDLMPSQVTDLHQALSQFQVEFCNRYGIGPNFFPDTLKAATHKAFFTEARNRKLLAVYIHHDKSIQSNVFCSQLLCAESIVEYLNEQYVCWAWDVTSEANKNRLLVDCGQLLGTSVADTIQRMKTDEFPLLILANGKNRSSEVTAIIKGNSDLNELLAKLIKAADDAERERLQDIKEEDARKAREKIKLEQEEAYRQSLEQDQAKILKEEEALKQIEEEKKMQDEAKVKMENEAKALLDLLPEEPMSNCSEPTITVRFRAPDNQTFVRVFLATESLQTLIYFVGSKGYLTSRFNIVKAWPKTDLQSLDKSKSLAEHKFHQQETLVIESRVEEDT